MSCLPDAFGSETDTLGLFAMSNDWPLIRYDQARVAFEAGQKLHLAGRVYLVRPVLNRAGTGPAGWEREEDPVLWVTDERTPGDHGLLIYPDGSAERK
jgi:hypothetical protein